MVSLAALLPLALVATTAASGAVDDNEAPPEPEAHEQETEHALSARVLAGGAVIADEHVPLAGVGIAFEQDVAHGAIAIEGAAELLTEHGAEHDENALLLELVVEKPIALTDQLGVYFGGGPALVGHFVPASHFGPAHLDAGFGALMLAGAEVEVIRHWELFVELDTAFLYLERPIVETDLGAGVMWRF